MLHTLDAEWFAEIRAIEPFRIPRREVDRFRCMFSSLERFVNALDEYLYLIYDVVRRMYFDELIYVVRIIRFSPGPNSSNAIVF